MKKRRFKKRHAMAPRLDVPLATPPPPTRTALTTLKARLSAPLKLLRKRVSIGWAILLGIISVVQFAYDNRPRVEIAAATLVDEHDPLSTLFLVTNTGRFHVDNLQFRCEIFSGNVRMLNIKNNTAVMGNEAPLGQTPLKLLAAGDSATRDCLAGPQSRFIRIPVPDPAALRINFSVEYRWPWVAFDDSVSRHFSTRRSPDGNKFLLVPDTEH